MDDFNAIPTNRRHALLAGAAALAGASALATAKTQARPSDQRVQSPNAVPASSTASPNDSPITTTIASPPRGGVVYRMMNGEEFNPENSDSYNRASSTTGWYTSVTEDYMAAFFPIPSGAFLFDVEFYVYNNTGSPVTGYAILTTPDTGQITTLQTVSIPSTGTIAATTLTLSANVAGPFPLGTKIGVSISTPTTGTVRINGVRFGFLRGGGQIGLLGPVRVFNGQLSANAPQTVTLPASIVFPGTVGAILNVTTSGAPTPGNLKIYKVGQAAPPNPTINYQTPISTWERTVALTPGGKFILASSNAVNVALDMMGQIV